MPFRGLRLASVLFLIVFSSPGQDVRATTDSGIAGVVALTVRREGIFPDKISVPAGRILFRISNRIGFGDLAVELLRDTGEKVKPVQIPRGRAKFLEAIPLSAGKYIVRVAGYPSLSVAITVTGSR